MKKITNTKGTTKPSMTKLSPESENTPIDTSQLEVGMVVKNYKALCELLGQPEKGGRSRTYQQKDWKCYFDWEKSGQKFIISDIYDTPLSKEDLRKLGNNSIYVNCIEVILLQYLSEQKGFTATLTKRDWWEILGLNNQNYGRIPESNLIQLNESITPFEIKHFYQRCNKKLEQILFSSLNSLSNRKLIDYEVETVIIMEDEFGNRFHHIAQFEDEKTKITAMERYVLHDIMGYERMIQVFSSFRQAEFYHKVNELLEEYYGWKGYFKQIHIAYTPKHVHEALPEMTIKLQKELLNSKVIDALNINAQNFYDQSLAEYESKKKELLSEYIGTIPKMELDKVEKQLWKPPVTYEIAQRVLTDKLVMIGHDNMEFSYDAFKENNSEENDFLWTR